MLHVLFSVYLKMLVLYSPFFVLSCFISLTRGYSRKEQRRPVSYTHLTLPTNREV